MLLTDACLAVDAVKIEVDPDGCPQKGKVELKIPQGAKKAAERYFRQAEKGHRTRLAHGFAVKKPAEAAVKGPSLGDASSTADLDLIEYDKDVEYVVLATSVLTRGKNDSFVIEMVNRGKEAKSVEVLIARRRQLPPVYRRVFSPDGGKTWDTIAWEPPQSPDRYPWTVELSPNTVQTVTIKTTVR